MRKTYWQNNIFIALLIMLFLTVSGCSSPVATEGASEPTAEVNSETAAESVPAAGSGAAVDSVADAEEAPLALGRDVDVQTVASVMDRDDVFLLDVREQSEYDAGHITGNTPIPTGSIADRLAEIPKDKEVIVYCHSGTRSARVSTFLAQQGYTNVHNMLGGIVAWQSAGFDVDK